MVLRRATLLLLASTVAASSLRQRHPAPEQRLLGLRGGGEARVSDALLFAEAYYGDYPAEVETPELCLFDFDGTLADSEDVHRLTFSEVLGTLIDEKTWLEKCVGTDPRSVMQRMMPKGRLKPGETLDDLMEQRVAAFEAYVQSGQLQATPGAAKLLAELTAAGVRCAVVTSGSRSYVTMALEKLGLAEYIEAVFAGDDEAVVASGKHKPHPFPYLHAAESLGVKPACCVAFEDSMAGIRSAQAAGMRTVVIGASPEAAPSARHAAPLLVRLCTGPFRLMGRLARRRARPRDVLFEAPDASPPPTPQPPEEADAGKRVPLVGAHAVVEDFDALARAKLGLV